MTVVFVALLGICFPTPDLAQSSSQTEQMLVVDVLGASVTLGMPYDRTRDQYLAGL